MKKMSVAALIAALVAPVLAFSAEVTGKVNVQKLNLRTAPGLKYPVAGRIANGTEVKILRLAGSWAEILAPASLPVYVSEARINFDNKTNGEVNVRSAKSVSAPCLMTLAKGVAVTRLDERANGWVRIVPPADLKLYAAAVCLQFDCNLFDAKGNIIGAAPEPSKVPEPPKPAEAASAPAPAPVAAPVAAPAPAPVAAPAPAADPAPVAAKSADTLTMEGILVQWKYSKNPATAYALLDGPKGKCTAFIAFDKAPAEKLDKKVTITGTLLGKNEAGIPTLHAQSVVIVKTE